MSGYTEDHLVEQPAIQLMRDELGWAVMNCLDKWSGGGGFPGFFFPALGLAEAYREIGRTGFPLAVGSLVFKQSL